MATDEVCDSISSVSYQMPPHTEASHEPRRSVAGKGYVNEKDLRKNESTGFATGEKAKPGHRGVA